MHRIPLILHISIGLTRLSSEVGTMRCCAFMDVRVYCTVRCIVLDGAVLYQRSNFHVVRSV